MKTTLVLENARTEIINAIRKWGISRSDISAILITGSLARNDNRTDQYSDIDMVVITNKPHYYQQSSTWAGELGKVVSCYNGGRMIHESFVKRIYFENCVGADITFITNNAFSVAWFTAVLKRRFTSLLKILPSSLIANIESSITASTYYIHRGFYMLVDKRKKLEKIRYLEQVYTYRLSSEMPVGKFENTVNAFWQEAFRMAIKISRKEYFGAKFECDHMMKSYLLNMITWYTMSKQGNSYETWHKGRFIEEWTEPAIMERVKLIYSRYDPEDTWRGLFEITELFKNITDLLMKYYDIKITDPGDTMINWIYDLEKSISLRGDHLPLQMQK
ncbi:hypothetical protein GO495_16830 [Chitinophaga oryziterrae]|uniref:Aminoglycoside 6-adenylyltransferase n=1 Tax=Chitinophaga oryziterrae TaxID=1031224 RepID=A0A6N8JCW3_9BACT|nr:aminoglycoside 6-adenylyltransferase [Chitinophaga oryziterrae]MVT42258.1 hypothetical protein [Chitinophaga oryziterrae]